jgi:hypothetical protein
LWPGSMNLDPDSLELLQRFLIIELPSLIELGPVSVHVLCTWRVFYNEVSLVWGFSGRAGWEPGVIFFWFEGLGSCV